MSRRKHVTLGLSQEVEPPTENQRIVQVVGPRGGNIVEVSYPSGSQTLVLLPNKFNKKLWLKRGGYVMIDEGMTTSSSQPSLADMPDNQPGQPTSTQQEATPSAASGNKITGTIVAVLYDDHVRQLKKLGAWPQEYMQPKAPGQQGPGDQSGHAGQPEGTGTSDVNEDASGSGSEGDEEADDDGLPALQRNTNRKVIVHYVSDDEDEDSDAES